MFSNEHSLSKVLNDMFVGEKHHWESLWAEIKTLFDRYKLISNAWLYGSVARSEDGPRSDIDVALIYDGQDSDIVDRIYEDIIAVEDRYQVNFSIVALSREDFLRGKVDQVWLDNVEKEGRVIKGRLPAQEIKRLQKKASVR